MEMPHRNTPFFPAGIAIAFIMLGVLGFLVTPASAQTTAKQKVVVHLTHYTDQLHTVKMAVHLAHMMQTLGAEVTLLLDVEGVRLASSKEPQNLIWGKGDPISVEYEAFVKAGGRVLVCPHCAEHAGITERDLRPAGHIGKDGELAKTILRADKVLDY
jgi:predicted peroxiredoxin